MRLHNVSRHLKAPYRLIYTTICQRFAIFSLHMVYDKTAVIDINILATREVVSKITAN